jgi:acetoin utilization protein AcuB
MIVSKHMSAPPITVSYDTDYKTAIGLMQKHRIRRLPVVDARGALAGIVAERDLLLAADHYLSSPVDVAQIMIRQVVTVGEETPVVDAATVMIERKIGGLPVVARSGRLLGIITETDLFKALAEILTRDETRAARAKDRKSKVPAARKAVHKRTRKSARKAR